MAPELLVVCPAQNPLFLALPGPFLLNCRHYSNTLSQLPVNHHIIVSMRRTLLTNHHKFVLHSRNWQVRYIRSIFQHTYPIYTRVCTQPHTNTQYQENNNPKISYMKGIWQKMDRTYRAFTPFWGRFLSACRKIMPAALPPLTANTPRMSSHALGCCGP
jgi:hypothetical protein